MRVAANISLMFTEWPVEDRFAAARDAGFQGVEIQFPYDQDPDLLARRREHADIEVVLINAPVGPNHPLGLASHEDAWSPFEKSIAQAALYAQALSTRRVNVLAGAGGRGPVLCDRLAWAQRRLAPQGAQILVEMLNARDAPGYAIDTLDVALQLIRECPEPLRLQFDVYHVTAAGGDAVAEIMRALPHVGHVQFADWSGRHEPGTGAAPIIPVLEHLAARGYAGWAGAEYRPLTGTLDGLGWLSDMRMAGLA